MGIVFAPYGNSRTFYEKYESSFDGPLYVSSLNLNGYEYMCNEGVHISEDGCLMLKQISKKYNTDLSIRAYDFLSLASEDEKERRKSIDILCDTVYVAHLTGAKRVIFPLSNCAIRQRRDVFNYTKSSLNEVLLYMNKNHINDTFLCPQTMGLIHNLGTIDEVISLCMEDELLMPSVSAGDIYARSSGKDNSFEFYVALMDKLEKKLGKYRAKNFHIYYSKVEYTHHGYRKDLDFCDCTDNNQNYHGLIRAVKHKRATPFIVCRSQNNSDIDCVEMKEYYMGLKDE